MGVDFTPDRAPDQSFITTGYQARLAAHYLRTLKDEGLCETEAIDLTKEWIAGCFEAAKDED